jgi:hypothetical protein
MPNDGAPTIIGQETRRATEPIRVGQIVYAQSATGRWSARLDSGESWYVREVDTIELLNALVASDREADELRSKLQRAETILDRVRGTHYIIWTVSGKAVVGWTVMTVALDRRVAAEITLEQALGLDPVIVQSGADTDG